MIDWRRIKRKRDIKREIAARKKFLAQVIRWNRSIRGVSPKEAKLELKRIREEEKKLYSNAVYKRGWYQVKPLAKSALTVRSHRRKGKAVRSYSRSYLRWTREQESFLLERERMRAKDLRESFFSRFGVWRSESSLITKRSRLRKQSR